MTAMLASVRTLDEALFALEAGADFITRDLAVGLKTSIATADRIKIEHGIAHPRLGRLDRSPHRRVADCEDPRGEPAPSLQLARTGGFLNRNPEIGYFCVYLLLRQHVEPAHQDRGFDHRRLRAVEAPKRTMGFTGQFAAVKTWARRVVLDALQFHLGVRQRCRQPAAGKVFHRNGRPVVSASQAAGENAHVVGVVHHRAFFAHDVLQRGGGAEGA